MKSLFYATSGKRQGTAHPAIFWEQFEHMSRDTETHWNATRETRLLRVAGRSARNAAVCGKQQPIDGEPPRETPRMLGLRPLPAADTPGTSSIQDRFKIWITYVNVCYVCYVCYGPLFFRGVNFQENVIAIISTNFRKFWCSLRNFDEIHEIPINVHRNCREK